MIGKSALLCMGWDGMADWNRSLGMLSPITSSTSLLWIAPTRRNFRCCSSSRPYWDGVRNKRNRPDWLDQAAIFSAVLGGYQLLAPRAFTEHRAHLLYPMITFQTRPARQVQQPRRPWRSCGKASWSKRLVQIPKPQRAGRQVRVQRPLRVQVWAHRSRDNSHRLFRLIRTSNGRTGLER